MQNFYKPVVVSDTNLSHAWGKVLECMFERRTKEIKPLLVSLSGFDGAKEPEESRDIRVALDDLLKHREKCHSVEVSAEMIFPMIPWRLARGDTEVFYASCKHLFEKIKSRNPGLNGRGAYFERLMFYGRNEEEGDEGFNQLDWVIQRYGRGKLLMMCQAAVFSPRQDLRNATRQGFPCMQHVSFIPTGDELILNAFYATQQLVERAYGNLLGLCHLGNFMADQMDLSLAQVNMMVGCEKLNIPKKDLGGICEAVRAELKR